MPNILTAPRSLGGIGESTLLEPPLIYVREAEGAIVISISMENNLSRKIVREGD